MLNIFGLYCSLNKSNMNAVKKTKKKFQGSFAQFLFLSHNMLNAMNETEVHPSNYL